MELPVLVKAEFVATLTIFPAPRATIPGATAWEHRKAPVRLTSRMRLHCSSVMASMSKKGMYRVIPALLTRTSTGPKLSSIEATIEETAEPSVMSAWTANACPPFPSIPSTTCSAASCDRE